MALDQGPEHLPRHAAGGRAPDARTALGDEHERAVAVAEQLRAGTVEVALQRRRGGFAERHQAVLAAFAADHADDAVGQAQVYRLQRDELADTQPAGVHQLEHRAVTQAQRGVGGRRREQRVDLRFRQRVRAPRLLARALQAQGRVVVAQPLAQRPAVEPAQRGQPAVRRAGLAAGEARRQVVEQIGRGRAQQPDAALRGQPARQQRQVAAVAGQRVRRQPVLEPHRVDEAREHRDAVGGRLRPAVGRRGTLSARRHRRLRGAAAMP
ncbi:hypothetical protein GALL_443000 [mine drainage metagenome]|uniref:Uncharacterized protein n=1 Tax=mine drainage metagenome TaxID=410659 RepID=A0A1J5Q2G5_9ZZZZ